MYHNEGSDSLNSKRLSLIHASRSIVPLLIVIIHVSQFSNRFFEYNFLGLANIPYSGGVDFFFVLSGFMIYYVYHRSLGNREKALPFLKNRLIRIYPTYWVVLTLLLPIYFIFPQFGRGYETNFWVIIKSYLLVPQDHSPILSAAWSLVYTVLFYLIFSVFIVLKKKNSLFTALIWIVVTIFVATDVLFPESLIMNYFFSYTLIKFALGCLVAHFVLKYKFKYGIIVALIGIIGFPLTWINYIHQFADIHLSLGYTISSVMIVLGLSSIDLNTTISIPKIMDRLSSASYSTFLVNMPVISFSGKMIVSLDIPFYIGNLMSSLLLIIGAVASGYILSRIVEEPLVKYLRTRFMNPRHRRGGQSHIISSSSDL